MNLESCKHCGGTAGTLFSGSHAICRRRAKRGKPTPSFGDLCPDCNGTGYASKQRPDWSGVCIPAELGPIATKRAIDALFPRCPTCKGARAVNIQDRGVLALNRINGKG